jgi:GNAT superfamily N-acetyltransferase
LSSFPEGISEVADEAGLRVWLEIRNALEPDDPLRLDELLARRRAEPERRELVARVGSAPIGAASVGQKTSPSDAAYGFIGVLPAARRGGVGSALLAALSAIARGWGRSTLELWAREDEPDGITFLMNRGYREAMRECGLALEVTTAPPPPRLPPGIRLAPVGAEPGFSRGAYDLASRTWQDIPSETGIPAREAWLEVNAKDAPDGALVALDGDLVVGFAGLHRLARDDAYEHGLLAVLPEYRRRGIARALKLAQVEWVRAAGGRRLVTWNAETNAAARDLNLSLGYQPLPASIMFRGAIR